MSSGIAYVITFRHFSTFLMGLLRDPVHPCTTTFLPWLSQRCSEGKHSLFFFLFFCSFHVISLYAGYLDSSLQRRMTLLNAPSMHPLLSSTHCGEGPSPDTLTHRTREGVYSRRQMTDSVRCSYTVHSLC